MVSPALTFQKEPRLSLLSCSNVNGGRPRPWDDLWSRFACGRASSYHVQRLRVRAVSASLLPQLHDLVLLRPGQRLRARRPVSSQTPSARGRISPITAHGIPRAPSSLQASSATACAAVKRNTPEESRPSGSSPKVLAEQARLLPDRQRLVADDRRPVPLRRQISWMPMATPPSVGS